MPPLPPLSPPPLAGLGVTVIAVDVVLACCAGCAAADFEVDGEGDGGGGGGGADDEDEAAEDAGAAFDSELGGGGGLAAAADADDAGALDAGDATVIMVLAIRELADDSAKVPGGLAAGAAGIAAAPPMGKEPAGHMHEQAHG